MTKIALMGYGKMGRAIHELALREPDRYEVALIVDQHNRAELTPEALRACDVAIEFTSPESAAENIRFCLDAGVACVSGSTGWTKQLRDMQLYALERNGAFLYAPNFSVGVNIFFEINRQLARLMDAHPEYDVTLEEVHHTEKKDSPSGTALFAALDILDRLKRKDSWKNRASDNRATLSILSKREAGVPGTHSVRYFSDIDEIEIRHTAHSRTGFASGALLAAEWLAGRTGAFSMEDVLGFHSPS